MPESKKIEVLFTQLNNLKIENLKLRKAIRGMATNIASTSLSPDDFINKIFATQVAHTRAGIEGNTYSVCRISEKDFLNLSNSPLTEGYRYIKKISSTEIEIYAPFGTIVVSPLDGLPDGVFLYEQPSYIVQHTQAFKGHRFRGSQIITDTYRIVKDCSVITPSVYRPWNDLCEYCKGYPTTLLGCNCP